MYSEPLNRVRRSPAAGAANPLPGLTPQRGRFWRICVPEFELARPDYEFLRESANVVNVERAGGESRKPRGIPSAGNRIEEKI